MSQNLWADVKIDRCSSLPCIRRYSFIKPVFLYNLNELKEPYVLFSIQFIKYIAIKSKIISRMIEKDK